jgi:hypothetical protein
VKNRTHRIQYSAVAAAVLAYALFGAKASGKNFATAEGGAKAGRIVAYGPTVTV